MSKRFEIFVDMATRDESIVDLGKGEVLSLNEACSLMNSQEDLIQEYINKRNSWKRTAGEELSKACKAETKLTVLRIKINQYLIEAKKHYEMSYEDELNGEIEAYNNVIKILDEIEQNLSKIT